MSRSSALPSSTPRSLLYTDCTARHNCSLSLSLSLSLVFCLLLPLYSELFLTVGKYQRPRARQGRVGETSTFLSSHCDRYSRIRESRIDLIGGSFAQRIQNESRERRVTCHVSRVMKRERKKEESIRQASLARTSFSVAA